MYYRNFLTEGEAKRINLAVAAAEKNTAGEIKVLVVQNSTYFPGENDSDKVWSRVDEEFFELGLDHTKDHTGILIMISLDERQVVVAAGRAINEFYAQETWQGIVDMIISGIKTGDPAKGICDAVMTAGEILADHFPVKPDDINEIPDEIVFKE